MGATTGRSSNAWIYEYCADWIDQARVSTRCCILSVYDISVRKRYRLFFTYPFVLRVVERDIKLFCCRIATWHETVH